MPMYEEPVVGAFYEDEEGRTFEVIAFDENDGTVEIQYGESASEEIDLDDWYGLDLERLTADEASEEDLDKPAADDVPDDEIDQDDEDDDYPVKDDE
jgi:hypothetical protein